MKAANVVSNNCIILGAEPKGRSHCNSWESAGEEWVCQVRIRG